MTINKNTRIVSDKLIKRIINKRVTLKSVKDTKDLIRILNSHNLFPSDNSYAEGIIKNKGYYFITGYRRVFIDSFANNNWTGEFDPNINIEYMYCLMEFDKRISDIMLNQLNNIERKLKVRASFFLAKEFGEDFYFNPTHFKNANKHNIFLKTTYKDVLNSGINSKNPIILHHLQNYYGRLPVWVLFEHISFGAFIKILSWLVNSNKNLIFNDIFISTQNVNNISLYMDELLYIQMLDIICFYRNRIAHLGRLYDWEIRYVVDINKVKPQYCNEFNPKKETFNFKEIVFIFSFFINKSENSKMLNQIDICIEELKKQIPEPYFSRIVYLMGMI